jgi:hypothetical protein
MQDILSHRTARPALGPPSLLFGEYREIYPRVNSSGLVVGLSVPSNTGTMNEWRDSPYHT